MSDFSSFLLHPDHGAATFIKGMFALSALGGFLAVRDLRKISEALPEVERRYVENVANGGHDAPDDYLRAALPFERAKQRIAPFPGALVTLGILGTFLGIGMAVKNAIPALEHGNSPQQVQDALRALLEAVQFKFQTSAWGILFSLAFIAFTGLVEAWLSRALEGAVARIAPARRTLASSLGEALQSTLREELGRGFGRIDQSLQQTLQGLSASASTLTEGVTLLASTVSAFGGSVSSTAQSLAQSSNKLGSLGRDIDASLAQVAHTLSDAAQAQQKMLATALGELSSKMQSATQAQQQSLNASLQQMSTSLLHAVGEQRQALDAQQQLAAQAAQTQQRSADELRKTINASLENMTGTIQYFAKHQSEGMARLEQHQAESAAALKDLQATLKVFQENNVRLLDIMERARESAAQAPRGAPVPRPAKRAPARGPSDDDEGIPL